MKTKKMLREKIRRGNRTGHTISRGQSVYRNNRSYYFAACFLLSSAAATVAQPSFAQIPPHKHVMTVPISRDAGELMRRDDKRTIPLTYVCTQMGSGEWLGTFGFDIELYYTTTMQWEDSGNGTTITPILKLEKVALRNGHSDFGQGFDYDAQFTQGSWATGPHWNISERDTTLRQELSSFDHRLINENLNVEHVLESSGQANRFALESDSTTSIYLTAGVFSFNQESVCSTQFEVHINRATNTLEQIMIVGNQMWRREAPLELGAAKFVNGTKFREMSFSAGDPGNSYRLRGVSFVRYNETIYEFVWADQGLYRRTRGIVDQPSDAQWTLVAQHSDIPGVGDVRALNIYMRKFAGEPGVPSGPGIQIAITRGDGGHIYRFPIEEVNGEIAWPDLSTVPDDKWIHVTPNWAFGSAIPEAHMVQILAAPGQQATTMRQTLVYNGIPGYLNGLPAFRDVDYTGTPENGQPGCFPCNPWTVPRDNDGAVRYPIPSNPELPQNESEIHGLSLHVIE